MNQFKFDQIGVQPGEKLPNLEVWSISGKAQSLSEITANTKQTVLITGSYTCDKTRSNLNAIDSLSKIYDEHIAFYLVNTIEAHPIDTQSPYSGEQEPWLAEDNLEAGIEAPQPNTMGERMDLAERWQSEQEIEIPIILDGPENGFWIQAGQGPNTIMVLSQEGEVVYKQPWFDAGELGSFLEESNY
ncbi:hypothetical protein J2X69_002260 [Algoriphagus sp. 4150]|uniref:deiodinase-like protein n=1 Tax=Algoriphagus sp. 4150 TaxID=2817756 RepID=UPI00285D16B6|nr:deiodinase-like protein [Algoriphagus sp. 4150]MDR7129914.1 hypothetical protein [Algoriphagus sp. 4150]